MRVLNSLERKIKKYLADVSSVRCRPVIKVESLWYNQAFTDNSYISPNGEPTAIQFLQPGNYKFKLNVVSMTSFKTWAYPRANIIYDEVLSGTRLRIQVKGLTCLPNNYFVPGHSLIIGNLGFSIGTGAYDWVIDEPFELIYSAVVDRDLTVQDKLSMKGIYLDGTWLSALLTSLTGQTAEGAKALFQGFVSAEFLEYHDLSELHVISDDMADDKLVTFVTDYEGQIAWNGNATCIYLEN